jgi:small-conductance mechanosensitive channel
MNWFNVMGIISTFSLFVPVLVIVAFRLTWYKSFPALLVYYTMTFCFNLLSLDFIKADKQFLYYFGVASNFLDAPLMLSFMTYFSKTGAFRKKMKMVIPAFVLFEIIVIAINHFRFTIQDAIIVLGPGLLLVIGLSLLFFIHQAKITIIHQKAAGKALVISSILFAYGGYSFIYVVYYLLKTPYKTDTFLVYYLVSIFSSLLLSAGIIFERKRVRELKELQTARKELKVVYGRAEKIETTPSKKEPRYKPM